MAYYRGMRNPRWYIYERHLFLRVEGFYPDRADDRKAVWFRSRAEAQAHIDANHLERENGEFEYSPMLIALGCEEGEADIDYTGDP